MAAEHGGVDLILVLSLIEADDSVVENEMLLGDEDSALVFTGVIPFMRQSLNRVEGFYTDTLPTYSLLCYDFYTHKSLFSAALCYKKGQADSQNWLFTRLDSHHLVTRRSFAKLLHTPCVATLQRQPF